MSVVRISGWTCPKCGTKITADIAYITEPNTPEPVQVCHCGTKMVPKETTDDSDEY